MSLDRLKYWPRKEKKTKDRQKKKKVFSSSTLEPEFFGCLIHKGPSWLDWADYAD